MRARRGHPHRTTMTRCELGDDRASSQEGRGRMAEPEFEYDVSLSFAGEQRPYVQRVAESLASQNVRVFYDENERATLWGRELSEHLDEVYRKKARYCIIFISQEYISNVWTIHERRSALARAIEVDTEYILPARFDDTEVPGIRSTVGFIDLTVTSPKELAALAVRKISASTPGILPNPAPQVPYSTAPETKAEQEHLIALTPDCWEYFLFAGILLQGRADLSAKRRDYELGYASFVRTIDSDADAFGYISKSMRKSGLTRRNLMRVVNHQAQRWAFGESGVPGDVENIIHLGRRFIDCYGDFFDWAADLRGTVTSDEFTDLYYFASMFLDLSIKTAEEFIDEYARNTASIPDLLAANEPVTLHMDLVLEVDPEAIRQYEDELERVKRAVRRS